MLVCWVSIGNGEAEKTREIAMEDRKQRVGENSRALRSGCFVLNMTGTAEGSLKRTRLGP